MESAQTPPRTVILVAAEWGQDDLQAVLAHAGGDSMERVHYVTSGDDIHALRATGIRYDHILSPADWVAFSTDDAWDTYADTRLRDIVARAAPGAVLLLGDLGGRQHALARRLLAGILAEQASQAAVAPGPGPGSSPGPEHDADAALAAVTQWRARRRTLPLVPYDQVPPGSAPRLAQTELQLADAMRRWGEQIEAPDLAPGDALRLAAGGLAPRAVHAWAPVDIFLQGYSALGDARYLAVALAFAGDWFSRYASDAAMAGASETVAEKASPWHTSSTALRCYRLAYLVDVLVRHDQVSDASLQSWLQLLQTHLAWLDNAESAQLIKKHSKAALGLRAARDRFSSLPVAQTLVSKLEDTSV